jgi:hypothetical protein
MPRPRQPELCCTGDGAAMLDDGYSEIVETELPVARQPIATVTPRPFTTRCSGTSRPVRVSEVSGTRSEWLLGLAKISEQMSVLTDRIEYIVDQLMADHLVLHRPISRREVAAPWVT